jgi:hypothetical protein
VGQWQWFGGQWRGRGLSILTHFIFTFWILDKNIPVPWILTSYHMICYELYHQKLENVIKHGERNVHFLRNYPDYQKFMTGKYSSWKNYKYNFLGFSTLKWDQIPRPFQAFQDRFCFYSKTKSVLNFSFYIINELKCEQFYFVSEMQNNVLVWLY